MNAIKVWTILLVTLLHSLGNGLSISAKGVIKPIRSFSSLPSAKFPSATHLSSGSSVTFMNRGGGTSYSDYNKIDWAALFKYMVGIAGQMSLIFSFFTVVDKVLAHFSLSSKIPFGCNVIFLYAFNLKSSLFSILPNKKSNGSKLEQSEWEYNKRKKPSWTPPGIAFLFGWPLLTFGLRAVTASMVVKATGGQYASAAIMSLMLHLGIGDLWNTVNNVERRLGVSVILLYGLWITKAFTALQFYKIDPLAGKLLALTLTWITAAVALETRTWQINPDTVTGKKEPLVPMQHPKWTTKFRWEE